MASHRGRSSSPQRPPQHLAYSEDEPIINTRQIEAFGRTVHATAAHIINANFPQNESLSAPYNTAISSVHKSLRRPMIQRSVFSFAKANPRELIRSNFNTSEIEHRAISHLPDELLRNIPQTQSRFSLLEGFKASLPDEETFAEKVARKRRSKHGRKMLEAGEKGPPQLVTLRRDRDQLNHRLEMMGIRKNMCASEIKEIDDKISNLNTMRKVILDRLADLEQEEHDLEGEIADVVEKIDVVQEEMDDEVAMATKSPTFGAPREEEEEEEIPVEEVEEETTGFMSESIYEKLPSMSKSATPSPTKARRRKMPRRISMPVLHEHMEPGSRIREIQAHNDLITALDFDAPFGTMVTAAMDDTVRVWDLNAGRCMGFLEGHLSSVRCLQVEDNIVATGSMDASIRLWDLSQADYSPQANPSSSIHAKAPNENDDGETEGESAPMGEDLFSSSKSDDENENLQTPPEPEVHGNAMADCPLFTLQAHVAEITALHFRGSTLVSGSADKTLRQWDLERGRCVQTLDVLWAAAQASSINPASNAPASDGAAGGGEGNWWRPTGGRLPAAESDFVGALQVFDAALACGTADGMVRLWDLRSGMVHRSLVGHTGPITALQFDDVFLVTASKDRSIRIWDLRTGTIHDAFAYDNPISSMMFDARRIVAAAGEDVVKVYDKTEGVHWDCGAGAGLPEGEKAGIVDRVRIKDGYMVEGRRDGIVGVWSC
ncbi:WD40-repeat-containing domain protein [Neohortaea acidophila]|uniref:Mitochondrial division protein 1 n=1 Tax=Neohortaea acidophila TaxID=245834 RepID=A0A6A6PSV6_9PEZI|nr:WD40-repeat-containing domain protein [Neohortaea acidophila]KAF2483180.1 WD40-repeat-containing domain protein [Neohortaea acidophila]